MRFFKFNYDLKEIRDKVKCKNNVEKNFKDDLKKKISKYCFVFFFLSSGGWLRFNMIFGCSFVSIIKLLNMGKTSWNIWGKHCHWTFESTQQNVWCEITKKNGRKQTIKMMRASYFTTRKKMDAQFGCCSHIYKTNENNCFKSTAEKKGLIHNL